MRRVQATAGDCPRTLDLKQLIGSALVVGGGLLLLVIGWWAVPQLRRYPWLSPQSYLNVTTAVILLVAGWLAFRSVSQRANAWLLIGAGWGMAFNELTWIEQGWSPVAQYLLEPVAALLLAWLLLRWPLPRLRDPLERGLLLVAALTIPTMRLLEALTWDPSRHGLPDAFWPTVTRADRFHDVVFDGEYVLIVALLVGLVVLVARRFLRAGPGSRNAVLPALVAAILMAVGFGGKSIEALQGPASNWWNVVGCAGELTVPLAFLGATALERLQRALAIEGVLGREDLTVEELQVRLADARLARTRLVEAAMAERRRIERDLHDGAQQRLLGAAAILGRARYDLGPDHPVALRVEEARQELRRALAELRDLVRGVHPPALLQGGLPAALEDLAGRAPIPLRYSAQAGRLPPDVELCAWFVIQEGVANAAKHADPGHVDVWVQRDDVRLRVTVEDQGRGGIAIVAGGGLQGLQDRVEALGGSIAVGPAPSGGSRLRMWLPCG